MSHDEDIDARLSRLAAATEQVGPRFDFSNRVMQRIGQEQLGTLYALGKPARRFVPLGMLAAAMAMLETVVAKITEGELTVRVPSAPATADPIAMLVVDPDAPAVPTLTALVLPVVVAPLAMFAVEAPVDVPKLFVPALKVWAAEKVCARPSAASVALAFGSV